MRTDEYDFELPPSLIAAYPAQRRDASRLMVLRRGAPEAPPEHRVFSELPESLREGDLLVLNESRVIPARLRGRRMNGGQAEILLTEPEPDGRWRALVKPGKKLPAGSVVGIAAPEDLEWISGVEDFPALVHIERELDEGERVVRLETGLALEAFLDKYGEPPLPPYIVAARKGRRKRETPDEDAGDDRERYQTVYAREPGSVAAPTAGLHFTPELMERLGARGVEIRRLTLHVGPGTFAPVKVDDPREHPIHSERFSIRADEAAAIEAARRDPARRVIAVGTTVVRVLETLGAGGAPIEAPDGSGEGRTRLMILPGHEFQVIEGMITNFHLPRSTLLMLVAAFAGRERVLAAYREAVGAGYRFYSYGDAMLIV